LARPENCWAAAQDASEDTTEGTRKRDRPKSETEVPPSGCALYRVPDLERRFADMSFSHTHLKLTKFAAIRSPAKTATSAPAE
jgi:hypothetical protein